VRARYEPTEGVGRRGQARAGGKKEGRKEGRKNGEAEKRSEARTRRNTRARALDGGDLPGRDVSLTHSVSLTQTDVHHGQAGS
jgi:hypothetical protein